MSELKFESYTSFSKIGAVVGLLIGETLSGGNRALADIFSIAGTFVGAHISMKPQTIIIKESRSQIDFLRDHFSTNLPEKLNPIETNYNLYCRDYIAELLGFFNKFCFNSTEREIEYRNKVSSDKYIIFNAFHDTSLGSLALDLAPAAIIACANVCKGKAGKQTAFDTALDICLTYGAAPVINYVLYTQGIINDYEHIELQFDQNEISDFATVLPEELFTEIIRVAE